MRHHVVPCDLTEGLSQCVAFKGWPAWLFNALSGCRADIQGLQVKNREGGRVSYCQVARILHDLGPELLLHLREGCIDVGCGEVNPIGKIFVLRGVKDRLGFEMKEPEVN